MMLVEAGADINHIPDDGVPVLSSAIIDGELETAKYLISQGAEMNIHYAEGVHNDNRTPLAPILACVFGNVEADFLSFLISQGAYVDYISVDDEGSEVTALTLALNNKLEEQALVLLENGADPALSSAVGTPLDIAQEKGLEKAYLQISELLE